LQEGALLTKNTILLKNLKVFFLIKEATDGGFKNYQRFNS
jgi:hypothetical protein